MAPEDVSQDYHIEGLPFGTRGGMLMKHEFPADAYYVFQVFPINKGNMGGSGAFGSVTGEQLEVTVDGEQVHQFDWDGELQNGTAVHAGANTEWIYVKAGLHTVGVTFLATNYAPGNDLNAKFLRSTIQTGNLPGMTFYPHVGRVRIEGPYDAKGAKDTPSRRKIFVCRPTSAKDEESCARQIVTSLAKRAFRRPPTPQDVGTLMEFYLAGRNDGNFDTGIERALRRLLADPEFVYRRETEPANVAPGKTLSPQRPRAGLAAVVLPLEQHPRRRADDSGVAGPAPRAGGARAAGAADDCRSEVGLAHREFHRAVAERPLPAGRRPDREPVSGFRRQPAPGVAPRDGAVLRQHRARGPERARSADGGLHVRQRTAGRSTTGSRTSTGRSSGASRSGRIWTCAAACSAKARC